MLQNHCIFQITMTITPKINICSLPISVFKQSKDNVLPHNKATDYEKNTSSDQQGIESTHSKYPKHPTT